MVSCSAGVTSTNAVVSMILLLSQYAAIQTEVDALANPVLAVMEALEKAQ